MTDKKRRTETVKVSRLGCVRKSTVEVDMAGRPVEHVELWTDEPKAKDDRQPHDDKFLSENGGIPDNIGRKIRK